MAEFYEGDHVVAPHPGRGDEMNTGIVCDNLSVMYCIYFNDGQEHFVFKARDIRGLDMTVNDELRRIARTCPFELGDVAGKVVEAELTDEQQAEALRRIRSKTASLLMQHSITSVLKDDWEATPENSKVQTYTNFVYGATGS